MTYRSEDIDRPILPLPIAPVRHARRRRRLAARRGRHTGGIATGLGI